MSDNSSTDNRDPQDPMAYSKVLRKRTRTRDMMVFKDEEPGSSSSSSCAQPPSAWSDRSGKFYQFQQSIRRKWPDALFQDEYTDVTTRETSCIVNNFSGNLDALLAMKRPGFVFKMEEGRLLLSHSPSLEKELLTRTANFRRQVVWLSLLMASALVVCLNYKTYTLILHA